MKPCYQFRQFQLQEDNRYNADDNEDSFFKGLTEFAQFAKLTDLVNATKGARLCSGH